MSLGFQLKDEMFHRNFPPAVSAAGTFLLKNYK